MCPTAPERPRPSPPPPLAQAPPHPCLTPSLPLPPAAPQVLRVLLDRLKNEITRLTAVKALATIARSPLNIGALPAPGAAVPTWPTGLQPERGLLRPLLRQLACVCATPQYSVCVAGRTAHRTAIHATCRTNCHSPGRTLADLSSVLGPALAELTSFLRKANRQLRQAALAALEVGTPPQAQGWEQSPAQRKPLQCLTADRLVIWVWD